MFTDPMSVTYNGSSKTLPRSSGTRPGPKAELAKSTFRTPDGEFAVYITQTRMADDVRRSEIILERVTQDSDTDPFNSSWRSLPNRVGLVFEVNSLTYATSTDINLLRTALLALVDSTFQGKMIGGEF